MYLLTVLMWFMIFALLMPVTPDVLLLLFLGAVVIFILGYALRGAIRRELSMAASEASTLALRLENAARTGAHELEQEVDKVITELRSKL